MDRTLALVDYLKEGGPEKVHNVDNLLLRESMDVIGSLLLCAPLLPPSIGTTQPACEGVHTYQLPAEAAVRHYSTLQTPAGFRSDFLVEQLETTSLNKARLSLRCLKRERIIALAFWRPVHGTAQQRGVDRQPQNLRVSEPKPQPRRA